MGNAARGDRQDVITRSTHDEARRSPPGLKRGGLRRPAEQRRVYVSDKDRDYEAFLAMMADWA
jgi:hypothetical protein